MDRDQHIIAVAQFYQKKNDTPSAIRLLNDGIAAIPSSFALREALAQQHLLAKDSDRALAVLTESLTISKDPADPGILSAKTKMAEIHLLRRELEPARALVDEVLAQDPKSRAAIPMRGS